MSTRLTREQYAKLPRETQRRIEDHPMCQGERDCEITVQGSISNETKAKEFEGTGLAGALTELDEKRPVKMKAINIAKHDPRFSNPKDEPDNHHVVKLVSRAPKALQEQGIDVIGQDPSHTQHPETEEAVESLAKGLNKHVAQLTSEDMKKLPPELMTRGYSMKELKGAKEKKSLVENGMDQFEEDSHYIFEKTKPSTNESSEPKSEPKKDKSWLWPFY